jgi:hypothetical protein
MFVAVAEPRIRKVFELTGLTDALNLVERVDDGVERFT